MRNRTILKAFFCVLLFFFSIELNAQKKIISSDLVNHSLKSHFKSAIFSVDKATHDQKENEGINFLGYIRDNSSNSVLNFLPAIVANGPTTFCAGQSVELSVNNTNKRFSTNVIAVSSEYQDCDKIDYSSCQALGEPNTFPSYGDFATAWSPFLQDNEREFIELGFDQSTATPINFIDIYETFGAGSVDSVFVKNPNTGLFEQVYATTAAPYGDNARILHVSFPTTLFNVSEIRIALNSGAVFDYNEIDAVSIGVEGGTYSWSNGETSPSITVTESGKYYVTVTDDNGNTETSEEIEVVVKTIPSAVISGDPIICAGSEANLTITITGDNTGLWSGSLSDGTSFESATSPINVKIKPTESNTYSITSLTGGFCEGTDLSGIATITVNQIPSAEISGSAEICKGSETELIITISGDGTGPWSGTITGDILFSTDQQTISIPVSPTSNTSYSITSFKGEYCTSNNFSGTADITLLEKPTAVLSGGGNMCAGSSKELCIAVTGAGPWTGELSDGTIFEGSESPILVSVNPESTTPYSIISLIGSVCEAKEADLTGNAVVTVQEIPSAFISGDADICSGSETELTITITGEGTGPWVGKISGGTDIIEFNEAVSSFTVKVKPAYSTVYYIESFSGKYCESYDFSGTATVNILERPSAVISGDAIICRGTETELTIDIIGEGSSFWTGTYFDGETSTAFSSDVPSFTIKVNPTIPTTYTIDLLEGDFCPAIELTGTAIVKVNEIPSASISGSASICAGSESELNIDIIGEGTGPWTGTLSDGLNTIDFSSEVSSFKIKVKPESTTTYTIATLAGGFCEAVDLTGTAVVTVNEKTTNTSTVNSCGEYKWDVDGKTYTESGTYTNDIDCHIEILNLTINTLPIVSPISGSTEVCIGSSIQLGNTTSNGIWSSASPLVASINQAGLVTGLTSGTAKISYKVTNENSCETIVSTTITVNPSPVVAPITGTTSVCVGSTTTLANTTPGGLWETDSPNIATISNTGVVTGISAGTVIISYSKSVNGCIGVSNITVTIKDLPVVSDIAGIQNICVGTTSTFTNSTPSGTWSSQNAAIATVSNSGLVSGVASGSTNIRYSVSVNGCNTVVIRSITVIAVPSAPASITITSVSDVCGNRVYRYAAPALTGTATGYQWSFVGTLGANASLDSGTLNSQVIKMKFTSNAAAATGDSARVLYTSDGCNSINRAIRLTNTILAVPTAPAAITITTVSDVCGNRVYRYTAPALTGSATGYQWSFVGTLGNNATIDSGGLDSRIVRMKYTLNTVAATGDSARVAYASPCGNSLNRTILLSNAASTLPSRPASITITSVIDTCGGRIYRYAAPALSGTASGYLWSFVGNLGLTAVLDSGTLTSRIVRMKFASNSAAATGDSARVAYTSGCLNSTNRTLRLTNTILTAPSAPVSITITSVIDTCGGRIFRYEAPALSGTASGYFWSFVGTLGANAVVDSGSITSRIVRMKFASNSAAATGDSARVRYTSGCGNSANRPLRLTNTILTAPSAPSSIIITTVSDVCGNRVYRYTAPALTGSATGYQWSFVGSLGLNAVIDSGSLDSRVVKMKYTLNTAAVTGDSVRVKYTSSCGNGLNAALKLSNTVLLPPSSITITTVSDVCGNRVYRYTAPSLTGTATGYLWSFVGTLGLNAVIDSGTLDSRIIKMKFTLNTASATGDSARVLYTSDCGNSLNRALRLTNNAVAVPPTPASITIATVSDVCGNRVYRYTAPALTGTATGYLWSFTGTLGLNAVVDSGTLSSRIVRMKYTLNTAAATGDSARVAYTSACENSLNRTLRLTNTAAVLPTKPASITITTVSDVCGARVYRYTAPALTGTATGYLWSFVGTLGLNAVVDSGTLNSRIVRMKFTLNTATATGDSARVAYTSACGNSLNRALRLTNTAVAVPTAPASITITTVRDVCGNRVYRYTAPALTGTATGYLWSFVGTLGLNAVVDSGTLNSRIVRMKYTLNTATATGDSARVAYTSACGNSLNRALKLTNATLSDLIAPSSITITTISDVCGNRVYRYSAPALSGSANGYLWSFVGTLGLNAVIDSGTLGSRIVRMKYTSNNAAATGDSVNVLFTTSCGNSLTTALKLSNTTLSDLIAPSSIIITTISDVCGNRVYRYTAPALTGSANGYLWSFVGTLGLNAVIDSGSLSSRIVRMKFTSNAAAATGDSARVLFTTLCGNSLNRALRLTNSAVVVPTRPASITITLVSDACGNRIYRYSAPALTGTATGYQWSFVGTLGLNATVDSGSLNSQVVRMKYTLNTAAVRSRDSARIAYTSLCGNSTTRALRLSNTALANCPVLILPSLGLNTSKNNLSISKIEYKSLDVKLFPNPSAGTFYLKVNSNSSEFIQVRIIDISGRVVKSIKTNSSETSMLGSELRAGIYFFEVKQGSETRIVKAVKY